MKRLTAKAYDLHERNQYCSERCTDVYLASDVDAMFAKDSLRTREHNILVAENRAQAARIAELELSVKQCGAGAMCCHQAARIEQLENALSDLHALVLGECPSLLNDDSGGCGELDIRIRSLMER